jgi:hypothetical protein
MSDNDYNAEEIYRLASNYFDRARYLSLYFKEGDAWGCDPLRFYMEEGARLGHSPNEFFDSRFYVDRYPDVDCMDQNPLIHYLKNGYLEKRLTLSENDVAARLHSLKDVRVDRLNIESWQMPCVIDDALIASHESIEEAIVSLNKTNSSAAIIKRNSDDWLVVFAGRDEEYFHLGKMMSFWGNILFLRDVSASYYCDNAYLPTVELLYRYIDFLTGERNGRTVLIGQSFGGHAALYQSSLMEKCITFGFSPQAYHPQNYPHHLHFEDSINKLKPYSGAPDIVEHLKVSLPSPRFVIVGKSEASHDCEYFWGDAVSAGLIAATGTCEVIVVNRREHPTIKYLDSEKFFVVLKDNFNLFESDPSGAADLLCSFGIYYSDR